MTWSINDSFADPQGRWNQLAPWDATEYYDSSKGFLSTQRHVDLRTFRVINEFGARPQSDLEATAQSVWESPVVQTTMEQKLTNSLKEPWVLSGSGLTTLTTGPIAARGGWPGLQMLTSGVPIIAQLVSSMTTPVDISAMNNISLIFPDYNSFDTTSTIQFTSSPDGTFGTDGWGVDGWGSGWGSLSTSNYDSATVPFSDNTSVMPQLLLAPGLFADGWGSDPWGSSPWGTGAGSKFKLSAVTGVRIQLLKAVAPARNLTVTLMALRALKTGWTESSLDFDTRAGIITVPVTLNGSAYAGTVAKNFEFIRGDGTANDPIPADGAYQIFFYPGGQTSPNDATGANYNNLDILVREIKNTGAGTGSFVVARLKWKDTTTVFEAQRIDMTGGAGGTRTTTTLYTQSVSGALSTNTHYMFRIELTGTQMVAKLYSADFNANPIALIWTSAPITTVDFLRRNGRVGFMAGLLTRDAYVLEFDASTTGYATFETKAYTTYTPVDGAQLAVKFAADANLFTTFTGPDLAIDPTKTLSGAGSFSASQSITSNQFIADDWTQTYLSLDCWVGSAATTANQPVILLNTSLGTQQLRIGKLFPNQWNHIFYDLRAFTSLVTGIGYSISISPSLNPDRSLGTFWIDNMTIGRRKVAWGFRAAASAPYREFRSMVNQPTGAVHLNPNERGILPQLQARALTSDAWVAIAGGPKLILHFAPLGNPVYDQAAWH